MFYTQTSGLATKRFLRDWQILSSQWHDWKVIQIGTNVLVQFKANSCCF
jgi:type II secretory pathway component PulL